MAEVHVATDTRLGRTVAVKIMRADFATDGIFLERFRREAHSVAQMNNPNIVNIYDSGEKTVTTETGEIICQYLVMEYVKGQTLRDILKVNGALSQRDAEQVMMGVLNALRILAPHGHHPPRHQARQHHDFRAGRGQGHGLRHRPRDRRFRGHDDAVAGRRRLARNTCLRSRRAAKASTCVPTCIPPAACCTKCSPAIAVHR